MSMWVAITPTAQRIEDALRPNLSSAGFLCVVAGSPFEFAGWFNNFSVDAPLRPQGRHMTTLHKY